MTVRLYFWLFPAWLVVFSPALPPLPLQVSAEARAGKAPAAVPFGKSIEWEGWTFNWEIDRRAGLVLTDVTFCGMKVLKYAGLAEIFVPYNRGEPRPHNFGQGIAGQMEEILPGNDCIPGSLRCQAFNAAGQETGKRVVMIHEESIGLAFKGNEGRAYGKRLVLWCIYNLGGYHYISRWNFFDDGRLMPEIGMTGRLNHTGPGKASPYGTIVGKTGGRNVFAPSHVHNIYYCLDFDVAGPENTVEEFNHQQDRPGSKSATHSWTPILRESGRSWSAENFRSWRVVNHRSRNDLGLPRSYELIPGGNGIFRGSADEPFAQAEVWVTRYHANEYLAEK